MRTIERSIEMAATKQDIAITKKPAIIIVRIQSSFMQRHKPDRLQAGQGAGWKLLSPSIRFRSVSSPLPLSHSQMMLLHRCTAPGLFDDTWPTAALDRRSVPHLPYAIGGGL